GLAPTPASDGPAPATKENTKNLHYGVTQIRAQIAAVEPQVRACIERAGAAGGRPTGNATLTFIVVQKPDRVVIEDTGVVDDKTTLTDAPLVDCLRETAREMKFEGLPREAEGIVVTREVSVDNGALAENKYLSFSYLR
ncbi:MAG: hypothetical protein H0X17_11170, partial [Deltaproteobacteria bacterium]|nr:hypothetical protein [Deltaproteobacteria bacterium]